MACQRVACTDPTGIRPFRAFKGLVGAKSSQKGQKLTNGYLEGRIFTFLERAVNELGPSKVSGEFFVVLRGLTQPLI